MLYRKQTVLKLHPEQHTDTHTYFQYEGDDDDHRVGYYLPMVDWVNMGCVDEITVSAVPGDQLTHMYNLRDVGTRGEGGEDWDIDNNRPMSETRRLEELEVRARLEVREAVEEWFSNVDLDDMFRTKGWTERLGE